MTARTRKKDRVKKILRQDRDSGRDRERVNDRIQSDRVQIIAQW